MLISAVDPGLRGCGLAIGTVIGAEKTLIHASYVVGEKDTKIVRAPVWQEMVRKVGLAIRQEVKDPTVESISLLGGFVQLVIELPQVYKSSHQVGSKTRTDPQDLIELAAVVGGITADLDVETTVMLPFEWKGQVPKEIMHDRARKRLSAEELAVISLPRASLAHNVWDAVSLFLKHVGRL